MSKKPPNRPGIIFEIGARVDAQDYLQKWYPSRIEKIDYEEGKILVHFDRWSHRYDEWIFWDSSRLRPSERPVLRKEGLEEEEQEQEEQQQQQQQQEEEQEEEEEQEQGEQSESLSEMRASRLREPPGGTASTEDQTELQQSKQVLRSGEEVLARWTDCRYYPAKVESVSKEGTYTVQFYDGVIRCVKRMHIKSMPEDAKGQKDWIALVKAATAAAKNKGPCKPRTSANSNKDKEERRAERASPGKEGESASLEEVQGAQEAVEEPGSTEKLDKTDASVEVEPKQAAEQPEPVKGKRKKSGQGSSFQAKRARLNKITGLLVSKVAYEDEHENKEKKSEVPQISEKEPSASTEEKQKTDTEATSSPPTQKHVLPSATPPVPVRSRNRRLKHDSGESTGSHKQSKSSCTVSQEEESASAPTPTPVPTPSAADTPQTTLPLPNPASPPRPSEQSQRRRRSQRLATFTPDPFCEPVHSLPSTTDGKRLAQKPESQQDLPVHEVLDTTSVPPEEPELPLDLSRSATVAATPPPPAPPASPPQPPETEKEESPPLKTPADEKTASPTTATVLKGVPKPLKPNKHTREPINTKKPEDQSTPKEPLIDLDHNKLKCKIPGCYKTFRKAKLLDYHLKYYHSMDKETESETGSPERAVRTRATCASVPTSTPPESHDAKRRRTVSTSASLSSHVHALQLESSLSTGLKPSKCIKKKRSSASFSSDGTDAQFAAPPREKGLESLHETILKRVIEKDKHAEPGMLRSEKKIKLEEKSQPIGKKKEKDKERKEKKEKDPFKVKQKKKKKKKKKSKQHNYSDFEDISLAYLERCASPVTRSSGNSLAQRNTSSSKHTSFQYPRAILTVDLTGENLSDIDFLEDSSTESLLLSGDEYNQDFDSFNLEDSQDEDDAANEIVRCICEMDEENGFMIQCEECMCWQHSVCMGLLEDSIPEQYICYVCRDPPGQRWSAKYRHDKDWLNKGHMYGLSFLSENYSHQNAKNIVSTHQLLADVYSVKKALRGLQLKMEILQNKHNPNLHLWARSWVNPDEEQPMGGFPECIHHQERIADCINHTSNQKAEDTYITSEHSYQKPPGFELEHNTAADFMISDGEDAVRLGEEPEAMSEVGTNSVPKEEQVNQESTEITSEVLNENTANKMESDDQARTLLQWQVNLLTHIDGVQNQVAGRMDLIEKELDVLESWLDFTGELEPPEPLARLPQLKRRIKQLLTDLGKVQQMSTLCSV
ncbi:PHD finger protein 20-like protein 1 isoform X3 [Polyodon spathula]|uniref:PHD finger protein 20-like protein 1 isoform X3 n=1 Tax=Polyodon spathula TaxID=7913 RepID=UPI001B7F4F07|nr:PHD finger protein 20-like protein 1 isoform X3 [Polyodon spathula]